MARGGLRTTSFKKGSSPIKKKGTKNKKTILKESLGLTNWEKLASYIKNEGAEKAVAEMHKLSYNKFLIAYNQLAEFVKPKLQRTTVIGDPNNPVKSELTVTIITSAVPIAETEEEVT